MNNRYKERKQKEFDSWCNACSLAFVAILLVATVVMYMNGVDKIDTQTAEFIELRTN